MARSLDKIKSINGSKETLKLSVRISNLWFIGTPNKSEQAEMVFVDSYFLKFLDDYEGDGPITVLLTHGRIKEAQELGIEARSGFKSHSEGCTQLSGSIQLSSKESFFGKAEAKTIADINTISKDGDVDLNASPQALDKLLGYELAFKIKVQPKFRNYAILKCSADSSLINVVMDMLVDAETSSKMDIPVSDSNHSVQHESLDDRTLQNPVLLEIEELLQANQRSLRDYPSMPYPEDANCPSYLDNSLILAELNYNNQELRSEFKHLFSHMTVLDKGIGDKYITQPWYKFLQEGDFSHGDELSFYYRHADKIREVVIRRAIDWDDSDID
ncbi:hypothetical protein JHK85_004655 [Glycine max]|nr:hypothetical protein JHK85_004655 [Glycine max]